MKKIVNIINNIRPDIQPDCKGFISEGVLDSIDVVFLVDNISKSFGIQIPTKDINALNFDSALNIYNYLKHRNVE